MKMGNLKIPRYDMDQVNLPDPVTSDISQLQRDNICMKERISQLERRLKACGEAEETKKERKDEAV